MSCLPVNTLCVNIDVATTKEANYGIFPSSEIKCTEKVLPPDARSIVEVSKETGINDQTIRNWIKKSASGILPDCSQESSPRFMTPKEKYQLVLEAGGIDNEQLSRFLRERGLHSEHLTIWDQEPREMIDKKNDKNDQELKALKKRSQELEKKLHRKEKALAEATALLLLKKSGMLLWRTKRTVDS